MMFHLEAKKVKSLAISSASPSIAKEAFKRRPSIFPSSVKFKVPFLISPLPKVSVTFLGRLISFPSKSKTQS